ncbi:MAG: cytochrome c3 family protein [Actinomycetes bacterium]
MMRRLVFLAACSAVWLMLGAAPAFADNGPHVTGAGIVADSCAGCHRVHTAKAGSLLKEAQPGLCYTCHGATGTGANTDVVDGLGYPSAGRTGTAGALRGGGFSYALIDSASPSGQTNTYSNTTGVVGVKAAGIAVTSTHAVDGTNAIAWGNGPISSTASYGATVQLRCGSCHDPHGNGNYRILRPVPNQSGAGTGVAITDTATKVYSTANYWAVEDANAPAYIANVSAWCTTCHTRYLSSDGGTNSGDAVFTYRHRSNETAQGKVTCIQCHVSHGSNASMGTYSNGVANPDGTAASGDSRLLRIDNRGTCQMCHNR